MTEQIRLLPYVLVLPFYHPLELAKCCDLVAPRHDGWWEGHYTEDLKKITVPALVMHGEADQIVPIGTSGPRAAELLKNGTLKTYAGFPHGMPVTQADTISADLLTFFQSWALPYPLPTGELIDAGFARKVRLLPREADGATTGSRGAFNFPREYGMPVRAQESIPDGGRFDTSQMGNEVPWRSFSHAEMTDP